MIYSKYPSRISLAGGSTDQIEFIEKFGSGMVINFPANIYNKIIIDVDTLGKNSYDQKYVIIYSSREEAKCVDDIKNDIVKYSLQNIKHFDQKFTTVFLSDINSIGSGLACSSSYTLAFNNAINKLFSRTKNNYEQCIDAYNIEKYFNPYLGMQDTFGCGIPGLKLLHFKKNEYPIIENIKTYVFENLDMHLLYTGIVRKSTNVLKTLNFKNDNLLKICEKFHTCLINNNTSSFIELIKNGWIEKKTTSHLIVENPTVMRLDSLLENDKKVLAHRLCGAGNGGYFLLFTEKNTKLNYNNVIKIDIVENFSDANIL